MPRHPDPANNASQERTRRWRRKLEVSGIPESDDVDVAVAAAVTAVWTALKATGRMTPERAGVFEAIVQGASRILVDKGFAEAGVTSAVNRRMSRWGSAKALKTLVRKAGIKIRMTGKD